MADYKATLSYLSEHNLRHFSFYPQSDKPIKAVLRHVPINTSPQEITLAIQSLAMMPSASSK